MTGSRLVMTAFAASLPAFALFAQDSAEPVEQDNAAAVTIGQQAKDQDPLAGREPLLSIEPVRDQPTRQDLGAQGIPALRLKVDPRVLGVVPGEPLPRLRREGEALRKRDGQLLPSGDRGYAVFIAEADPEAGDDTPVPMVVAPCMMLESMERLLEDRGDDLRFTITGEVHTYRGINYLLPTTQPKPWLVSDEDEGEVVQETADTPAGEDAPQVAPEGRAEEPAQPAGEEAVDQVGETQAPKGTDEEGQRLPTADEVLGELLLQRSEAPEALDATVADAPSVPGLPAIDGPGRLVDPLLLSLDPDQPQAELRDEGQFVVARTGRLVRSADGSHALFVFDADQAGAPEPPMILHACKLLETMESAVLKEGDDIPFVITGQVFVYRGANYLLPTIVKREFNRGNLK